MRRLMREFRRYAIGIWLTVAAATLFFLPRIADAASDRDLFVSPTGSDVNNGTQAQPLATLQAARDTIRKWKSVGSVAGGVTVWLEPGVYELTAPFELSAQDSGAAGSPVMYRPMPGQIARLLGARRLKAADFLPVMDAQTLRRIAPPARGRIVELDLKKLGVRHSHAFPDLFTDAGGIVDLFFAGQRMNLSRYPNEGFMTMQRVVKNGGPGKHDGGVFQYREGDASHFQNWKNDLDRGVWLKGYWRVVWQNEALRLKAIDTQSRTATFISACSGRHRK